MKRILQLFKPSTTKDLLESNPGIFPSWIFYLDFVIPIVGFSVLFLGETKYTSITGLNFNSWSVLDERIKS